MDLIEVAHVIGLGQITFSQWLSLFRPAAPFKSKATERAFDRWKQALVRLGFASKRQAGSDRWRAAHPVGEPSLSAWESFHTRQGPGRRGRETTESIFVWDLPASLDWAQAVLGEYGPIAPEQANVPTADEVLTGRGERSLSDWRVTLPLRDPIAGALLGVLGDQQVPMTAAQLGEFVRTGARGKRVFGGTAAARRALETLVRMGFVRPIGHIGRSVSYEVTGTGYEAAIMDASLRAEQELAGIDPAAQAEAYYARRAGSAPTRSRSPRTRTMVEAHAAKRPPCGLCEIPHGLHAHASHSIDALRYKTDLVGRRWPYQTPAMLPEADTSFAFGALANAQPIRGPHPKCQQGYHDWDRASGLCRRRGCTSQIEDAGQSTMFGADPTLIAEAEVRRRMQGGQTGMFDPHSNPDPSLLALVGLGNSPERSNPAATSLLALVGVSNPRTDRGYVGEITAAQARKLARASRQRDQYDKTQQDCQQFHQAGVQRYAVYRIDDGKRGVTREWATGLGRVPKSFYRGGLGPSSNKNEAEVWHHDHKGEGPLEVKYAATGLTGKVGGEYRVDDWMRD